MTEYGMETNGLSTEIDATETNTHGYQHSNNLDGLLRDSEDRIIPLDPRDYRHQCFCGPAPGTNIPEGKHSRFVFRNEELVRVAAESQDPYAALA